MLTRGRIKQTRQNDIDIKVTIRADMFAVSDEEKTKIEQRRLILRVQQQWRCEAPAAVARSIARRSAARARTAESSSARAPPPTMFV